MQFQLVAAINLSIDPKLTWIIYSRENSGFIVGDAKQAFSLPYHQPNAPSSLVSEPVGPRNLPVPSAIYDEFRKQLWHGFQFLDRERAGVAPAGDLLRLLVFLPDYGDCVLHPPTNTIISLRSGSIEMLDSNFKSIEKTKTRGKAALAFAAHPREGVIVYGDNAGSFHAQRFEPGAFGKASKIIAKERKASRVEFANDGALLVIGGMGYLQTLSCDGGKFSPLHETAAPVRDFLWLSNGQLILVNQGMHGVAALRYDDSGFSKLGEVKPAGAVGQIAASADGRYLAATDQESSTVHVFELLP